MTNPDALKTVSTYREKRVHHPDGTVTRRSLVTRTVEGNSEAVGMALYTDYLVPFEVASLFLLVAMIGAIVIGKRELSGFDEDLNPQYMIDRVESEKEVKEAMGA